MVLVMLEEARPVGVLHVPPVALVVKLPALLKALLLAVQTFWT